MFLSSQCKFLCSRFLGCFCFHFCLVKVTVCLLQFVLPSNRCWWWLFSSIFFCIMCPCAQGHFIVNCCFVCFLMNLFFFLMNLFSIFLIRSRCYRDFMQKQSWHFMQKQSYAILCSRNLLFYRSLIYQQLGSNQSSTKGIRQYLYSWVSLLLRPVLCSWSVSKEDS